MTGDTMQLGGTLAMEIGGDDPGVDHDQLSVIGTAQLGGALSITLIGGYEPALGAEVVIIEAASVIGAFDVVDACDDLAVRYEPDRVVVVLAPACGCAGDGDGDGQVDLSDLLGVLAAWRTGSPSYDFDGDGIVGTPDLLAVLAHWGPCA